MSDNIQIDFYVQARKQTVFEMCLGSFMLGGMVAFYAQAWVHGWITAFWSGPSMLHLFGASMALSLIVPAVRRLNAELTVDAAQSVRVQGNDGPAEVTVAGHIVASDGTITPKNPVE